MESTVEFEWLGMTFGLNTTLALIVVTALIILFMFYLRGRLSVDRPGKVQVAFELLIDFVRDIVNQNFSVKETQPYQILALSAFVFILVSNLIGLPFLVHAGGISYWRSPTADVVVCVTMALLMNIISQYLAIKRQGFGGYLKHHYFSSVIKFPVTVIEEAINMLTLSLRLYGNIFAGEVLLSLIASFGNSFGLLTWIPAIPLQVIWQGFSLFIGGIQAYIFVNLSMVYLADKVQAGQE